MAKNSQTYDCTRRCAEKRPHSSPVTYVRRAERRRKRIVDYRPSPFGRRGKDLVLYPLSLSLFSSSPYLFLFPHYLLLSVNVPYFIQYACKTQNESEGQGRARARNNVASRAISKEMSSSHQAPRAIKETRTSSDSVGHRFREVALL